MRPLVYEDLGGFYSNVGLTLVPWLRCFLVGKKLFISRISNPFLVGVFLIRVKGGAQDISLYTYACRSSHA